MEGRFVVAFVCMVILAELKSHLKNGHEFSDRRKKAIKPCEYSVQDVIDLTQGIVAVHGVSSNHTWVAGQLKEVKRLLVACGLEENLYDTLPSYITSPAFLR